MSGARIPTSTMTPSTKSATRDDGLRRIRRKPIASGDSRGRATLVGAESRVCPDIEQVGEKTSNRDHDAADDDSPDDEWIITGGDGVDDGIAHTWPGKDLLDEECAGQKRRE